MATHKTKTQLTPEAASRLVNGAAPLPSTSPAAGHDILDEFTADADAATEAVANARGKTPKAPKAPRAAKPAAPVKTVADVHAEQQVTHSNGDIAWLAAKTAQREKVGQSREEALAAVLALHADAVRGTLALVDAGEPSIRKAAAQWTEANAPKTVTFTRGSKPAVSDPTPAAEATAPAAESTEDEAEDDGAEDDEDELIEDEDGEDEEDPEEDESDR